MKALIYKPSKSVTQSGTKKSEKWILEFKRISRTEIEPLMKWTSSSDTQNQVKMKFSSKELAISCLLYTSPSPRDGLLSRMPSSA